MQPVEELSGPTETLTLVERYRRGDEEAARLLFDRYVQRLLELAGSNLPPGVARRFGPEDVVQSVFRSLFRAVKENRVKLERSGDLWAWLLQVTFNKLRGRSAYHLADKRSVKREEELPVRIPQIIPPWTSGRRNPRSRTPGDSRRAGLPLRPEGLAAPQGGRPRLQGFSMEEIGARLGTSHATVSRQLKKIGRRFEERLRNQSERRPRGGSKPMIAVTGSTEVDFEGRLIAFEEAWRCGMPPDLDDYLGPPSVTGADDPFVPGFWSFWT